MCNLSPDEEYGLLVARATELLKELLPTLEGPVREAAERRITSELEATGTPDKIHDTR